jgi:hypothetical protein
MKEVAFHIHTGFFAADPFYPFPFTLSLFNSAPFTEMNV